MDVTPTTGQTPPARGKAPVPKTTAAESNITVKPARRRKASGAPPETSAEVGEVSHLIATTAYYLAAARNFEPGHELEDWLEAERRIRSSG